MVAAVVAVKLQELMGSPRQRLLFSTGASE